MAPTQPVAVIANNQPDELDFFVWGLIPNWAADPKIGSRMINARAETLAEKPSFRVPFRRRRCLVLADGFYEWQKVPGQKAKRPMHIGMADGSIFAFAGLWETWHSPGGDLLLSCTIITTQPNDLVAPIHNRMPVVMQRGAYDLWLDPDERRPEDLQHLLEPYPAEKMAAYEVSRAVNNPRNEMSEVAEPVA
ncbi:MAG: SOS response-associated peptidase [Anaerolineae bacterium]